MNSKLTRRQLLNRAGVALGAAAVGPSPLAAATTTAQPACRRFSFALNTGTIRGQKLGIVEEIEVAAKAGYDGIEPWTGDIAKFAESGGSLKDLRKRCQDLGLKIVDAIGFAQWIVDDDAQRAKGIEQFQRDMELVAQLGGTRIAAPPAGAHRAARIDLDRVAERYRAVLELGRKTGVVPQLEVWGSSTNLSHAAEAAYVVAKTGHPDACVLLDTFHMYKGGVEPSALKLFGRQATHCFHMNDYPADPPRDTIKDANRIWPGDGIAPLKEILANLAANHCDVVLSLELFNPDYWKLPALEAAKTGLAKLKAVVKAAEAAR
ncbi:MAG: sugar phosphate isomerase/epimerase [Verrucomicrobia bacterium]|nr:sugar phosphate isomerase/epimerase [Verrucomicrobiota bacterium]